MRSGAAPRAHDADHPFEGEDRVATAALDVGVGLGEHLNATAEAVLRPAGEIAPRAVDPLASA